MTDQTDYRSLLKRYLNHVADHEGVYYVDSLWGVRYGGIVDDEHMQPVRDYPELSDDDITILKGLIDEIHRHAKGEDIEEPGAGPRLIYSAQTENIDGDGKPD